MTSSSQRGCNRTAITYATAIPPAKSTLAVRRTGPLAPICGISLSSPAGANMKKTPARKTAWELAGIDFQNLYCADHEFRRDIGREYRGMSKK